MPYIIVKALAGRGPEQKRELARRITDATVELYKVNPEAVTVRFEEVEPDSLAVGGVLRIDARAGS